jgi:hypothetical protein
MARADDIEREINGIPANGAVGLAVKMYLHLHHDDENFRLMGLRLQAAMRTISSTRTSRPSTRS